METSIIITHASIKFWDVRELGCKMVYLRRVDRYKTNYLNRNHRPAIHNGDTFHTTIHGHYHQTHTHTRSPLNYGNVMEFLKMYLPSKPNQTIKLSIAIHGVISAHISALAIQE